MKKNVEKFKEQIRHLIESVKDDDWQIVRVVEKRLVKMYEELEEPKENLETLPKKDWDITVDGLTLGKAKTVEELREELSKNKNFVYAHDPYECSADIETNGKRISVPMTREKYDEFMKILKEE